MTLIQLLEYCQWLLKDGNSKSHCEGWLLSAGVAKPIIGAILDTLNEDGSYRRVRV